MISGIYNFEQKQPTQHFISLLDMATKISCRIVNSDGEHVSHLILINKKTGKLELVNNISLETGFELNDRRQIKIE